MKQNIRNIQEDFVSSQLAVLLKEKGFDELCIKKYNSEKFIVNAGKKLEEWQNSELYDDEYSAPTHQRVLKWLRKVHNILIIVDWTGYEGEFHWTIQNMKTGKFEDSVSTYNSFEAATEDAIEYCLKKLI